MPKKGQYAGPRAAADSTSWLRNFAGRYQQLRGALRGLSLEAETRRPMMRKQEQVQVDQAISALDAAFTALHNPVDLTEKKPDPLREPAPRGPYK